MFKPAGLPSVAAATAKVSANLLGDRKQMGIPSWVPRENMGKYWKYIPKKQLLNWGKNLKISTAMLRCPDGDAVHASSEMWFKNEWILFWQARSLGSTIGSPRSSSHSYRACSSPVQWCGRWIHPWFESEEIPTGGATESRPESRVCPSWDLRFCRTQPGPQWSPSPIPNSALWNDQK